MGLSEGLIMAQLKLTKSAINAAQPQAAMRACQ